jgi:hypothetical protein
MNVLNAVRKIRACESETAAMLVLEHLIARERVGLTPVELHRALDELLAGFMATTRGTVLDRPIRDLVEWSYQQTQAPDPLIDQS